MNQATFIGNLTKTAETKTINGGRPFTTFSLAVNRKWKDKEGNKREEVQYIDCILNGNVTALAPYLTKGTKVCVTGRIGCHAWTDKNGHAMAGLDLNVRELELLGGRQEGQQQPQAFAPSAQVMGPQGEVLSQEFVAGNNAYGGGGDLPF